MTLAIIIAIGIAWAWLNVATVYCLSNFKIAGKHEPKEIILVRYPEGSSNAILPYRIHEGDLDRMYVRSRSLQYPADLETLF
jgi:hypothetical protein